MNDISRSVIRIITAYNNFYGQVRAAYTFDAGNTTVEQFTCVQNSNKTGPNAVIYTLEPYVEELLSALLYFYPAIAGTPYVVEYYLERC